jgi:hypothetical protein
MTRAEQTSRPETIAFAHPVLAALIADLPAPGSDWSTAQRACWLQAMAAAFEHVYPGPADPPPIVVVDISRAALCGAAAEGERLARLAVHEAETYERLAKCASNDAERKLFELKSGHWNILALWARGAPGSPKLVPMNQGEVA